MKRLQYIGSEPYKDPGLRFVLKTDDLVDFEDNEANQLLSHQPDMWKEVTDNASIGSSSSGVQADDSSGHGV